MDREIIIVTIVLMTICILPFYLMSRKNIRKKKHALEKLQGFAAKNACNITHKDLWSGSAIAIDPSNKLLLYSTNGADSDAYRIFGLVGLRDCAVIKSENAGGAIKKLGLLLSFSNSPDLDIEFYNENRQMALNHELELANKWKDIISTQIKLRLPAQK